LKDVIEAMLSGGGTLIDTASTYGNAEAVIGSIVEAANIRQRLFLATKIEVQQPKPSSDEFQRSLRRLRTSTCGICGVRRATYSTKSILD
jgi:aryl-alcohol dehydrogenase-like predicted oxidoreductase